MSIIKPVRLKKRHKALFFAIILDNDEGQR